MKFRTWMWSTAMCLFAALAITVQTSAQSQMITPDCPAKSKFTTFHVLGSAETVPSSINPAGAITGYYSDARYVQHGFLRAGKGTITTPGTMTTPVTITTFDVPGSVSTYPSSINPAGVITGNYSDASYVSHGFLRARDGSFTTFDPSGSVSTVPSSINPAGAITGNYSDASYVSHGFLRARDGSFTTFDAPGSVYTVPLSINPSCAITGYYYGATGGPHGFLWSH